MKINKKYQINDNEQNHNNKNRQRKYTHCTHLARIQTQNKIFIYGNQFTRLTTIHPNATDNDKINAKTVSPRPQE
jgi:hypothetical protein